MDRSKFSAGGYILAGALGATIGGIAVAILKRAIPSMMSRMMSNMMENMMMRMGGEGCEPRRCEDA